MATQTLPHVVQFPQSVPAAEPKDLEAIAREALMPAVAVLKPKARRPR